MQHLLGEFATEHEASPALRQWVSLRVGSDLHLRACQSISSIGRPVQGSSNAVPDHHIMVKQELSIKAKHSIDL